jgi:hypothetical protein
MQRLALLAWVSVTCLASEARAQQLDSLQGIASDLTFIEQQVTKTLNSLGSPASGYPVSGGDSGTWTKTVPSSNGAGWTTGFFSGRALAAVSGDDRAAAAAVAHGGGAMDRPAGLAGLECLTGGPH